MAAGESGESKANSPVEAVRAGALDSPEDIYCPECDYNLRGLTSDRCPECGYALDFTRLAGSQIPWVHRKRIGWYRAYWKTVWLVMFRSRRFCREIAHRVSYRDSQSFRWISVLHAFVPLAVMVAVRWFEPPVRGRLFATNLGSAAALGVVLVSLFLCLGAITGLPSYFFHPKHLTIEQQNRAVAMSYYACAALAWTPLAFGCFLVSMLVHWLDTESWAAFYTWYDNDVAAVFGLLGTLLPFGQVAAWWLDLIHIARRSLRRSTPAVVRLAVAVPILWILVGGLVLIGIPFTVLYVAVVVVSFG